MLKLQCFIGWVVTAVLFSVFVSTIYIIYRFDTGHFNCRRTKPAWRSKHFIRPYILIPAKWEIICYSHLSMILLDSVVRPPPLASVCWHQNSIIRIMIHSMISVFGVHFDDSDKCEKEKLGERFYRTEFSFFIFLIIKGIFGINMILSSLHQGTHS